MITYVRNTSLPLAAALFMSFFFSISSAHAVVFVKKGSPSGGDGTSWQKAFSSIEEAIFYAGEGEDFWIAKGSYTPGSSLSPKQKSRFFGGFNGNESSFQQRNVFANKTIIDGLTTLPHIFTIFQPNVTIDGLVIQNGNSASTSLDRGAGVLAVDTSNLLILNSTFNNNQGQFGGAVHASAVDITIHNCQFTGNTALRGSGRGGAVWTYGFTPVISESTFTSNKALIGGAVEINNTANGVVYGSTFINNTATKAGGAIATTFVEEMAPSLQTALTIESSTFKNNSTQLDGGAVWTFYVDLIIRKSEFNNNSAVHGGAIVFDYYTGRTSLVDRCTFRGNSAQRAGGAINSYMRDINIENSLFTYNTSDLHGGAVSIDSGSGHTYVSALVASIKNSTFYGNEANSAQSYGGALFDLGPHSLSVENSIFWANRSGEVQWVSGQGAHSTDDIYTSTDSPIKVLFSNLESYAADPQGRYASTTGTFSSDPLFNDVDGADNTPGNSDDDFGLRAGSPCLDQANGDYLPQSVCDINEYPRIDILNANNSQYGGSPTYADIGAFERLIDPNTDKCPGMPTAKPDIPVITPEQPPVTNSSNLLLPCFMLLLN